MTAVISTCVMVGGIEPAQMIKHPTTTVVSDPPVVTVSVMSHAADVGLSMPTPDRVNYPRLNFHTYTETL